MMERNQDKGDRPPVGQRDNVEREDGSSAQGAAQAADSNVEQGRGSSGGYSVNSVREQGGAASKRTQEFKPTGYHDDVGRRVRARTSEDEGKPRAEQTNPSTRNLPSFGGVPAAQISAGTLPNASPSQAALPNDFAAVVRAAFPEGIPPSLLQQLLVSAGPMTSLDDVQAQISPQQHHTGQPVAKSSHASQQHQDIVSLNQPSQQYHEQRSSAPPIFQSNQMLGDVNSPTLQQLLQIVALQQQQQPPPQPRGPLTAQDSLQQQLQQLLSSQQQEQQARPPSQQQQQSMPALPCLQTSLSLSAQGVLQQQLRQLANLQQHQAQPPPQQQQQSTPALSSLQQSLSQSEQGSLHLQQLLAQRQQQQTAPAQPTFRPSQPLGTQDLLQQLQQLVARQHQTQQQPLPPPPSLSSSSFQPSESHGSINLASLLVNHLLLEAVANNPILARQLLSGHRSTASTAADNAENATAVAAPASESRRSVGIPLALANDGEQLSEYQVLVRKQLEFFSATKEDVESSSQGRKKQVVIGQVGIRCRYCSSLPLRQRGRGAVYYPTKLSGVYQAAQNMASSHLSESCHCISDSLKQELRDMRERRQTAKGGKQYWASACRALGLYEVEGGIRIRKPLSGAATEDTGKTAV